MIRTFFLFLLVSLKTFAQEPGIVGPGITLGAMNYIGDLDDDSPVRFIKPAFGVNVAFLPYGKFNASLSYLHGEVYGDDAMAEELGNKYRNLKFYSSIDEISLQFIYRFQSWKYRFLERKSWIPYIFAGISYFHFNPKVKVDGVEYELQKVGTEGQYLTNEPNSGQYPKSYSLWQFNFPFGVGVKYKISNRIDVGLEFSLRKTFTDYLDDVSNRYPDKADMLAQQGEMALYLSDPSNDPRRPNGRDSFARRGDPTDLDWYSYTSIGVNYYFTTKLYKAVQAF